MYRLSEETPMDAVHISAYIQDFKSFKQPELKKYKDYFEGKHIILQRAREESKPNNRIVHPYANYITNTLSSYFMGNPVAYNCQDDNTLTELNDVFKYNDEPAENLSLAKDASIYGVAYELSYVDREGEIRFSKLEPLECIPIYDDTIEAELLYLIRFYDVLDIVTKGFKNIVEVYTRDHIDYYSSVGYGSYTFLGSKPHGFNGMVPVTVYKNNEEEMNDYGKVISLIDAYDEVVSDSVNDMDQFADSYLVLKGLGGVSDDDFAEMKSKRILLLDDESDAKFLVKDVNDTYSKNVADRINDDIYKFSSCVDLTSDISALSGIAIKMRMLAMENISSAKETQFKKGLLRRIELISLILKVLGKDVIENIDIKFTRNLPTDETDSADLVTKLQGIVSDETLLSLLPFIDDPQAEVEKIRSEGDIYGHTSNREEDTSDNTDRE